MTAFNLSNRLKLPLFGALLCLGACFTSVDGPAEDESGLEPAQGPIIVSATQAALLLEQDGAVILDTRSKESFEQDHLPGSQRVEWLTFSNQEPAESRGTLKGDLVTLERDLSQLGVSMSRRVLVVGNTKQGWGEDGRITWMLRALGHEGTSIVDGGFEALSSATAQASVQGLAAPATFEAQPTPEFTSSTQQVQAALDKEGVVFLDAREEREFSGETPYGETRGGHLPGAVHVHFGTLLSEQGMLKPEQEIKQELLRLGVGVEQEVIAYCTAGVRSAWVVMVLRHLGYERARNYAGSMWEWSAQDADTHPLE